MKWSIKVRKSRAEAKQHVADALPREARRVSAAVEHLINALPAHLDGGMVEVETSGDVAAGGFSCEISVRIAAASLDRRQEDKGFNHYERRTTS